MKIFESIKNGWIILRNFVSESFRNTPIPAVFETALLLSGALRSYDFLKNMGQSSIVSVVGLVFAEVGLIFHQILLKRGRRIEYEYTDKKGNIRKRHDFLNQKRLAQIGLWWIHLPIVVFFSGADVIMQNVQALAGKSDSIQEMFTYALGGIIAVGVMANIIIVILYQQNDPEERHKEEMSQLNFNKQQWELEKERIEAEEQIKYERRNAPALAEKKARLKTREKLIKEFDGVFDRDYILRNIESEDDDKPNPNNNGNEPRQKRTYKKRVNKDLPKENNSEDSGWGEEDDFDGDWGNEKGGSEEKNNNQENFPKSQNSENIV
jgi:hypothetical protein